MPHVLRRRRTARKAAKLARLLAALDSVAGHARPEARRVSRLSLGRT
jgi:hypothetical protein